MGTPMKKQELDHQALYLRILDTLRPELAETLRLESATSGAPVEVVVVGGADPEHPAVKRLVGEEKLGRVIVRDEADSGAMMAAGAIVDEISQLYRRAVRSHGALDRDALFIEVLGDLDPRLAEVLQLESAFSGDDLKVRFDVDDEQLEAGVVSLGAGEESEKVRAAAAMADSLYEIMDSALVDAAEPRLSLRQELGRIWDMLRRRD